MRHWNRSQRLVAVIALGVIAAAAASAYVAANGPTGRWFGYAPNTGAKFEPDRDPYVRDQFLPWVAAAVVWALCSIRLLRTPTSTAAKPGDGVHADQIPATKTPADIDGAYAMRLSPVGVPTLVNPRTCGPPPRPAPVMICRPSTPTCTPPVKAGS